MFIGATNRLSQSAVPLVHQVIPIFDGVTRAFDATIDDPEVHPIICSAAKRGLAMLNKYYGLTDDCIVYRIAMRKSYFNS